MLSFKPYTGKDIQNMIGLLTRLYRIKNEMSVKEALIILNKEVELAEQKIRKEQMEEERTIKKVTKKARCPSCERGFLLPVVNNDGLEIVACKSCRFSTIINMGT